MPHALLRKTALPLTATCGLALMLAGCAGGSQQIGGDPDIGVEIFTPGFESYTTDHNGFSRIRLQQASSAADEAILAQFDDADPATPDGYRSIVVLSEDKYLDNMSIEVIAKVSGPAGSPTIERILRITADQSPFDNLNDLGAPIASGKFYFRGNAQVYATVDGGALQHGVGDLENMVIDFDDQSVAINLRTPFNPGGGSDIETWIDAEGIPFNIQTGAFGGEIEMSTRSADTGETLTSTGQLRGNVNGDAEGLSRQVENMTSSGLFTVGSTGDRFRADGVFWGSQLNYPD